jgi:hypothetical protein
MKDATLRPSVVHAATVSGSALDVLVVASRRCVLSPVVGISSFGKIQQVTHITHYDLDII